MADGVPGG